jgi:hypothetical protein
MNWDYIAGLFDGEGNIHLNFIKINNRIRALQLGIRIYNSNEPLLKEVRNFINSGYIYKKNRTNIFEVMIIAKEDVKSFLINIKDKVVLKKDLIKFVLDNYHFDRNNNLNFDVPKFRTLCPRREKKDLLKITLYRILYKSIKTLTFYV